MWGGGYLVRRFFSSLRCSSSVWRSLCSRWPICSQYHLLKDEEEKESWKLPHLRVEEGEQTDKKEAGDTEEEDEAAEEGEEEEEDEDSP